METIVYDSHLYIGPRIFPINQSSVLTYFAAFEMFEICSHVYNIEGNVRSTLSNEVTVECGNIEGTYSKKECVELKNVEAPSNCKLMNNYLLNVARELFTQNFTIEVVRPTDANYIPTLQFHKEHILLPAETIKFDSAREGCRSLGLKLPEPKSEAENEYLSRLNSSSSFVLGMTREPPGTTWRWLSDMSEVTWFNWKNDTMGAGRLCASVLRDIGGEAQWTAHQCDNTPGMENLSKILICERDKGFTRQYIVLFIAIGSVILVSTIIICVGYVLVKMARSSDDVEHIIPNHFRNRRKQSTRRVDVHRHSGNTITSAASDKTQESPEIFNRKSSNRKSSNSSKESSDNKKNLRFFDDSGLFKQEEYSLLDGMSSMFSFLGGSANLSHKDDADSTDFDRSTISDGVTKNNQIHPNDKKRSSLFHPKVSFNSRYNPFTTRFRSSGANANATQNSHPSIDTTATRYSQAESNVSRSFQYNAEMRSSKANSTVSMMSKFNPFSNRYSQHASIISIDSQPDDNSAGGKKASHNSNDFCLLSNVDGGGNVTGITSEPVARKGS